MSSKGNNNFVAPKLLIEDRETHLHITVLVPGYHNTPALIIDFTNNYENAIKLGKEKDKEGNSGVYAFGGYIPNERTWGTYVGETNNFTERIRSHLNMKAAWFASLDRNTKWYLFAYSPGVNSHWGKEDRTNIEHVLSQKIEEMGGVALTNRHNANNYGQIGQDALENFTNDILYVIKRFTGWKVEPLSKAVHLLVTALPVEMPAKQTQTEKTILQNPNLDLGGANGLVRPITFYIWDKGVARAEVIYNPSEETFTLLKGAKPRDSLVPSAPKSAKKIWGLLQTRCVNGETQKNIVYKTSSGLAVAILGRATNGKIALVDKEGKTLKEYLDR